LGTAQLHNLLVQVGLNSEASFVGFVNEMFSKVGRNMSEKMLWIFLDPFPFEESIQLGFD